MRVSLLYKGNPEIECVCDFPKTPTAKLDEQKVVVTAAKLKGAIRNFGYDIMSVPETFARKLFEFAQTDESFGLLLIVYRMRSPTEDEIALVFTPQEIGMTLTTGMAERMSQELKEKPAESAPTPPPTEAQPEPPSDELKRNESLSISNEGGSS